MPWKKIADALLKLDVPGAGFLPDIWCVRPAPAPANRESLTFARARTAEKPPSRARARAKVVARATTVLFIPRSTPAFPAAADAHGPFSLLNRALAHPLPNIPDGGAVRRLRCGRRGRRGGRGRGEGGRRRGGGGGGDAAGGGQAEAAAPGAAAGRRERSRAPSAGAAHRPPPPPREAEASEARPRRRRQPAPRPVLRRRRRHHGHAPPPPRRPRALRRRARARPRLPLRPRAARALRPPLLVVGSSCGKGADGRGQVWSRGTSVVGAGAETKAWATDVPVSIGDAVVEPVSPPLPSPLRLTMPGRHRHARPRPSAAPSASPRACWTGCSRWSPAARRGRRKGHQGR